MTAAAHRQRRTTPLPLTTHARGEVRQRHVAVSIGETLFTRYPEGVCWFVCDNRVRILTLADIMAPVGVASRTGRPNRLDYLADHFVGRDSERIDVGLNDVAN